MVAGGEAGGYRVYLVSGQGCSHGIVESWVDAGSVYTIGRWIRHISSSFFGACYENPFGQVSAQPLCLPVQDLGILPSGLACAVVAEGALAVDPLPRSFVLGDPFVQLVLCVADVEDAAITGYLVHASRRHGSLYFGFERGCGGSPKVCT